jgi:hypothetical protein
MSQLSNEYNKSYENLLNEVEFLTNRNKELEEKQNQMSELLCFLDRAKCSPSRLLRMIKSDSVFWSIRRSYKNPSSSGMDDLGCTDYLDFYELIQTD